MKRERKNKVLFLSQLPPPVHGVSVMNKLVLTSPYVEQDVCKKVVSLNFSNEISQLQKITLLKIAKTIVYFFRILYYMLFFRPDAIYFSLFPFGKSFFLKDYFYLRMLRLFNANIILHIHNSGIKKELKSKRKAKKYRKSFSNLHVVFLSEIQKNIEIRELKLTKTTFHIIRNGIPAIDVEQFKKTTNSGIIHILFFSNFFVEKGVFVLVDAYNKLLEKHSNIHLTIAGQDFDNNAKNLRNFILEKNINNKITIITDVFDDDKWRLFGNADIFVFPSFFEETSSLVILEAMQFGLPIIASRVGAIPELLTENHDALFFEKKNIQELKRCLSACIENPELRKQLGQNAKQSFLKRYNIDTFNKSISELFKTVIK